MGIEPAYRKFPRMLDLWFKVKLRPDIARLLI